jgi:choice-of-anchor C domain-containing protein
VFFRRTASGRIGQVGSGLLLFAVFSIKTCTAQAPSLIVNGSFEETPPVGRFLNVAAGATSIQGWVVTGEGVDVVVGSYWPASDGDRSIDLDGSAGSRTTPPYMQGGVAQTFPTTPGTKYLVSFDLAGNPVQRPVVKPMRISAAGQSAEFTFDVSGKDFRNMGWVPKSWTFIANEATTTLEFRSLTTSPLTGFGAAIDNVIVTALDTPTQLKVTENDREIQVNLEAGVLFDTGKYDLKPEATAALQELTTLLKSHPELPILIEGHTDSVGKPEANQLLSENRANSVGDWLTSEGEIPSDRITTKGYGQTAPVAPNDTPEGRQKNGSVEIKLQKQ